MTPVELLKRLGLDSVEKSGRLEMLCPFHADTNPSSGFYLNTERFYCYACELSLDVPGFYAKFKGIPRADAMYEVGEGKAKIINRALVLRLVKSWNSFIEQQKLPRLVRGKWDEKCEEGLWEYEQGLIGEVEVTERINELKLEVERSVCMKE